MSNLLTFILTIEDDGDGYRTAISAEDGHCIIDGQWGDTVAESAMTACYNALDGGREDPRNHWGLASDEPQSEDLPYVVGLNSTCQQLRRFASEEAASAFVSLLDGHNDGIYYIDGPERTT